MIKNTQSILSISLVTYNAAKYLRACLNSLSEQSFKDWQILIIDNGSSDDTISYIRTNYPHFKIVEHKSNLGFAQAHNQAIAWTKSDYVMCMNQDIILDKHYLKETIKFLDAHKKVASVTGKLFKWDFANDIKTNKIDTLGLQLHKNYRVTDKAEGQDDTGQFATNEEVFGVSGAAPVYRRQALTKIKLLNSNGRHEYFDEDFFAYKEDVDLAFRLRLAGYQAYYVASAKAWHDRSTGNSHLKSNWRIAKAHRQKNKLVNYLSYRNHLLVLYKNCFRKNLLIRFLHIGWYELRKFVFMKMFSNINRKEIKSFYQLRPIMKLKRKQIEKLTKINSQDILKWSN